MPNALTIKQMKDLLFKVYQWPPSCIPNDRRKLERLVERMREKHPKAEKKKEPKQNAKRHKT